jgi:siroheme synthase
VAAISQATTAAQDVVRCTLGTLAGSAVLPPATLVIGAVAAFELVGVGIERSPLPRVSADASPRAES